MSRHTGRKSPGPVKTDLDDWETDPDFVRDMDEIDQRWGGTKRTVGSINMNELIDEVRKDHQAMRDRFSHPSQRDHSEGFGGKYGIQHDRKDQSAHDYDYHEKLSKHTSQEIRKVITSSKSSLSSGDGSTRNLVSDAKKTFMEKSEDTSLFRKPPPPRPPSAGREFASTRMATPIKTYTSSYQQPGLSYQATTSKSSPEPKYTEGIGPRIGKESSTTKHIVREERSSTSSTSSRNPTGDLSPAFKSIQEKIDAFKKEFEDIESKLTKKSDLSNVIKKTTNVEKNVEYVTRSSSANRDSGPSSIKPNYEQPSTSRPTSTSPTSAARNDVPTSSIKSLSEKFETLCKEDSENFKRQTEARRRDIFDQIKTQVRETRKELDGFDPIDRDDGDDDYRGHSMSSKERVTMTRTSPETASTKYSSRSPSGRLPSSESLLSSSGKPKVYTRRETTQEEIISKIVKENDRVIENETKRNVQRSSSCHGSSDEEESPTSIKHIDRELRSSPVSGSQRVESPIDELKRRVPVIEPEIKGAGLMARTLYDYQAADDDELSFDVDDLITNIEKVDSGWYKGTITYKDGRKCEGLFPANYVKLLNDSGEY